MAEKQAEHRRYLEKSVIESEIKDSRMGLWFGFIISIIALVGATICAVVGQFGVAIAMGGGSIAALVSVFIYGSSTRRKERENKYKAEVDD